MERGHGRRTVYYLIPYPAMVVRYTDTTGRKWSFGVQGTPYQIRIFRRVLSTFRGITGGERLSLSYLADFVGNDAFAADVEAVVLAALSQRFPAPTPQAARPKAQAQERPPVDASRADDAEADRVTYYWEKF